MHGPSPMQHEAPLRREIQIYTWPSNGFIAFDLPSRISEDVWRSRSPVANMYFLDNARVRDLAFNAIPSSWSWATQFSVDSSKLFLQAFWTPLHYRSPVLRFLPLGTVSFSHPPSVCEYCKIMISELGRLVEIGSSHIYTSNYILRSQRKRGYQDDLQWNGKCSVIGFLGTVYEMSP